jgi:hypothetical protein
VYSRGKILATLIGVCVFKGKTKYKEGQAVLRIIFCAFLLGTLHLSAKDEDNKKEKEVEEKVYICLGVEGYSSLARGDIYIQTSNYVMIKGTYDIEHMKACFLEKIKKRWPYFSSRGQVTAQVCETTKEARLHLRSINKHRHSLHTRRITFTRSDL